MAISEVKEFDPESPMIRLGISARLGVMLLNIEVAIVIATRIEALVDLREGLNFIVRVLGDVSVFGLVIISTFGIVGLCSLFKKKF